VWISLKTLCSKVLATFADHYCLLCLLMSSRSMKGTASDHFISRLVVCRSSDSSCNSIDSSLLTVDYKLRFLALLSLCVLDLLIRHAHATIACNGILVVTLGLV
jgi:hypothetical protein